MSFLKYLLPVAAAVAAVHGQDDECSISGTATIQNVADATGIAACGTFTGSIAIATDAPSEINLEGLQVIDGNLAVREAPQLITFSAGQLQEITGDFELNNVQILATLNLQQLRQVDSINWSGLPALGGVGFTNLTEANNVTIQNTNLNNLSGFNLAKVGGFRVQDNPFLRQLTLQLGTASNAILIASNNGDLDLSLPNLKVAGNLDLSSIGKLSIPSLQAVNGSYSLRMSNVESFVAPNLTSVGSFAFSNNNKLANISAPELTTVRDDFKVSNNTELSEINGVPKLMTVGGALDLSGNFTDFAFPALTQVSGTTNVQSSGDINESCRVLRSASNGQALRGEKVNCASNQAAPGDENTTPTGAGANAGKEGAATRGQVSAALLGFSGLVMFALL